MIRMVKNKLIFESKKHELFMESIDLITLDNSLEWIQDIENVIRDLLPNYND